MNESHAQALSPSISCDWMHHSRANFGATPFKYSEIYMESEERMMKEEGKEDG